MTEPQYPATCDVSGCTWVGGNYSSQQDRDNAVTVHKGTTHPEQRKGAPNGEPAPGPDTAHKNLFRL